jgi:D-alanine-D-alanine ligase
MQPRVVVAHDAHAAGGRVDASDVLLEAQAVVGALNEIGFETAIVPVGLDLAAFERTLVDLAPRVVFNLVESLEGRGQLIGVVPALLESLGVPFTGCSSTAQSRTSNKLLAKRQLLRAGLPTPAVFQPDEHDASDRGQWIVKSVWEHASLGLDDTSVVRGGEVERSIAARRDELGGEWFAERFVPGRELNVALIAADDGPLALPVAEIRFEGFPPGKPKIVGYAAKWHGDSFEYRHTVRAFGIEPELAARAEELALECWGMFELAGYARVDLRADAEGKPWVLEVNANPCLSPDAGFAAALAEARVAFPAAVAWLIEDALRRATPRRAASPA